jgi:hypothetical protein
MSFLNRLLGRAQSSASDVFSGLRDRVLSVKPDELGLAPTATRPNVWAAFMEWGLGSDVAMLVTIADGTVSLYLSGGGGVIGAGGHDGPRRAAEAFLDAAESHRDRLAPVTKVALVGRGRARFHVRTFDGDLTAGADEESLSEGRHPLSALFASAQDVITAIRESTPEGSAASPPLPNGPPPGTAMTLEVAEAPSHEERVVAQNPDAEAIGRVARQLSWSDVTFVVLRIDDENWMETSGSSKDGFSAKITLAGETWISSRPPESLDEMITLLVSYRNGDNAWQDLIEWVS